MSKHYISTLVMAVLVLVLLGAIYWVDHYHNQEEQSAVQNTRVFARVKEPVDEVGFVDEAGALVMTRRGESWYLREPVRARANRMQVDRIVASLERLRWVQTISQSQRRLRGLRLGDYGLGDHSRRIFVESGGVRETLRLGDDAPFGEGIYGQREGQDDVWVLPELINDIWVKHSDGVRDRQVFRGSPERTVRIDIHRRDEGFLQLRRRRGEWYLQQPVDDRADEGKVQELLGLIYGLQIERFVWDADADDAETAEGQARIEQAFRAQVEEYGLASDSSWMRLGVWLDRDSPGQDLLVGMSDMMEQTVAGYFARKDEMQAVFTVPSNVAAVMELSVNDLRDGRVVDYQTEQLMGVQLTEGENRLRLMRSDSGWSMTEPVLTDADDAAVAELLDAILGLQAIDYQPSDAPMNMEHNYTLDLWVGDRRVVGASPAAVRLHLSKGAHGGRAVWRIQREGDAEVMIAERDNQGWLQERWVEPSRYASRDIMAIAPEDVLWISVETEHESWSVVREGEGEEQRWVCRVPESRQVNENAVAFVLSALSDLQAERVVDFNPAVDGYGLSKARYRLMVGIRGAHGIQKQLFIGKGSARDGHYARLQGSPFVYLLDSVTVDALTLPLWTTGVEAGAEDIP